MRRRHDLHRFEVLRRDVPHTLDRADEDGLDQSQAFRLDPGAGIGGEYTAINSSIQELVPARYRGRTDLAINGSYWLAAAVGAPPHSARGYRCAPARIKLAEAKIYSSPSYHMKGISQLLGRYTTGREATGLLINYVRKAA